MTFSKVQDLVEGLLDENRPIDMAVLRDLLAGVNTDDFERLKYLAGRLEQWPAVANVISNKAQALKRQLDDAFDKALKEDALKREREKAQAASSADDDLDM
jgi:hypothetical protein